MAPLSMLKTRLSHLRRGSWHDRLTSFAWGKYARKDKACPYWWLVVPSSLPMAGLKLVVFLMMAVLIACVKLVDVLVASVGWFAGFRSYGVLGISSSPTYYSYKHKGAGPDAPKARWAPWQIGLPLLAIGGLVYALTRTAVMDFLVTYGAIALGVVGVLAGLCILGLIFKHVAVPSLRKQYAKRCPEIEWVAPEPQPAQA